MAGFDDRDIAVVIGASGGIGAALTERLRQSGKTGQVIGLSRPDLDLTRPSTIAVAAGKIAERGRPVLVIIATGVLRGPQMQPEKSLRDLDPDAMAAAFAVNATGPALCLKHLLPLLPRDRKAVCAVLSAKVGSIADNRLGGWYAYRASKAALNQIVRTAAIELGRTHPQAACVAIHPGTVASRLSDGFAKTGLTVQQPADAAAAILGTVDRLTPQDSGAFLDRFGSPIPW